MCDVRCRSQGALCIPRSYSYKFEAAVARLLAGEFGVQNRQRIRVSLTAAGPIARAARRRSVCRLLQHSLSLLFCLLHSHVLSALVSRVVRGYAYAYAYEYEYEMNMIVESIRVELHRHEWCNANSRPVQRASSAVHYSTASNSVDVEVEITPVSCHSTSSSTLEERYCTVYSVHSLTRHVLYRSTRMTWSTFD